MGICGMAGGGGNAGLGIPNWGIPGICPAGGAGAGGAARFEIILVYSLGPCGAAAGGGAGVPRNAWVAPPPGPYVTGGAGAAAGPGGVPDGAPVPNMRVYSPNSCGFGGWVGTGAVFGNCDAEGNCGPAGILPGEDLKNCVNPPPVGAGGPACGGGGGGA
jgi:hypothetical protein